MSKDKKINVLDLFAGAGGFSEGFINAGCSMVAHIEMDKNACETIKTRMVYHALKKRNKLVDYKQYMLGNITRDELVAKYKLQKETDSVLCAEITNNNYRNLFKEINKRLCGGKLNVIIGGPPCQAYSDIGRARDKKGMRWDRRNTLYRLYVKFLEKYQPEIFVFENVKGLLSAAKGRHFHDMRRLMEEAGYAIDYQILNAAEYGVPQNRKRVIIIGWNKKSKLKEYPVFTKVERNYKVKDFLCSLPSLRAGEEIKPSEYKEKSGVIINLGIYNPVVNVLEAHIARPHTAQDKEIYQTAVEMKARGVNISYNMLPEKLKTHQNQKSFLDRFKVVDFDSESCQTVVAHISKDGHYYIHPDPKQNRSLTVREAARLQTFPDDYKFEGNRTSQFRQIGNAVPPIFSKKISEKLVRFI